jgi:hypothetical protein
MEAGSPPPPSLLGKQSQSGNIRFTVGQYSPTTTTTTAMMITQQQ